MNSKIFTVTPDQVANFRNALAAHGIECPSGNSGTIKPGWGIVLGFSYDGTSTLVITIVNDGWDSADDIWHRIGTYLT